MAKGKKSGWAHFSAAPGRAICLDSASGFYTHHLPGYGPLKGVTHARHQWTAVIDVIARCDEQHDSKLDPGEILLILDALVDREKDVRVRSSAAKQRSVLHSRPAHFRDGPCVMAGDLPPELSRHALIQQHAHGRPEPAWLPPTLPRPAPASRWGSRPETRPAAAPPPSNRAAPLAVRASRQKPAFRRVWPGRYEPRYVLSSGPSCTRERRRARSSGRRAVGS